MADATLRLLIWQAMGTTSTHFHIVTARHGNTTLSIALSIALSIGIDGDIALATTTDAGLVHADTDATDLAPTTRGLRAFGASACGAEPSCARLHRARGL